MGLFHRKSKEEKALDDIILRLQMNMANNYKDNAQDNMKDLEVLFAEFKAQNKLKGKTLEAYESQLAEYREKLKGFTHKDQTPYWT